jgi:hypothetical protein
MVGPFIVLFGFNARLGVFFPCGDGFNCFARMGGALLRLGAEGKVGLCRPCVRPTTLNRGAQLFSSAEWLEVARRVARRRPVLQWSLVALGCR